MFESPAADCSESELSLDAAAHIGSPSVFLMRAQTNALSPLGVFKGSVLVVDKAISPVDGCIVVAVQSEGFVVRQWQVSPPALVSPRRDVSDIQIGEDGVELFGVVSHSLTDHRRLVYADH